VYRAKATRSTLLTFNKVDRVEFNIVASMYQALRYFVNVLLRNAVIFLNMFYIYLLFVMCAVCPANWTPNSPTIKPDPVGSKEYFSTVN